MGGGVVGEIFPVNKSLTFPRFRDIFGAFSSRLRIIRRLWTLAENSGTLPMSAYTFKPRNNINSFRKKTFTKSLGGPWPPWPPLATPLPAQDHFIFLAVLIISMTFVLSLTQMLVFLSLYVMLSILLSIFVCAAASLFCACLVSVHVSAPYVIAGSTQELYTCLFRQMARLLLKISRCLAYAAQPAMILRCISLSWFFSLRL